MLSGVIADSWQVFGPMVGGVAAYVAIRVDIARMQSTLEHVKEQSRRDIDRLERQLSELAK